VSHKLRNNLLKYGISILVGLLATAAYLGNNPLNGQSTKDVYRVLSDAFSIPGLLAVLGGALMWVSANGALDGISYILSYVVTRFIPFKRDSVGSYRDYVNEKEGKRPKGYGFLFLVGLIFLAVSVVFLYLYSNVS